MNNEEMLDNVKKLIDEGKLGEIPDLKGDIYEVADRLVNDRKKFATLLCYISALVDGKYIRLLGELAETSIRYKKARKAFLPNVILDILYFLQMIKYISVKETEIIAEILDNDLANELNILKANLLKEKPEFNVDEYYKSLYSFKETINDRNN